MTKTDMLERTAIVTYTLLHELHRILAEPRKPDEISLGIILGTAMFCDDKVGPFRARRLLQQAPEIVLKADAHVTDQQISRLAPSCKHLASIFRRWRITRAAPWPTVQWLRLSPWTDRKSGLMVWIGRLPRHERSAQRQKLFVDVRH